jgi:hypothetical protein
LEKSGQKNKFFFTPFSLHFSLHLFKKCQKTGDSSNVPGNHNPKVASSNLATATTKLKIKFGSKTLLFM